MTVKEFAPAKINLTLHVTGRRSDGYHLLDSLVVFAGVGDWLEATVAPTSSLSVAGPRAAGVPEDGRNLILKAAALMPDFGARFKLEKHLPAASGIGGGSADAAAALRLLSAVSGGELPTFEEVLRLGADVPVCLNSQPCRMQGIGDQISPVRLFGAMHFLLVNPLVEVHTPDVFRALDQKDNAPMPAELPELTDFNTVIGFLKQQRNDLQVAAIQTRPVIADVLNVIAETENCALSRMSGSGATCFGLFNTAKDAARAAAKLRNTHPEWWATSGPMFS
ncbi:MAG: 4-(cytidine 5'-diphospho)-2-C-methyl-D-erythritol kinase [Pseudoruegeria sp.]